MLHLSCVSHGHQKKIASLLQDLALFADPAWRLTIVCNIPEDLEAPKAFPCPVEVVRNPVPMGFAANHNQVFKSGEGAFPFFAVLNPDLRLPENPFPPLLQSLSDPGVGVAAPLVRSPLGEIEASARAFPTPFLLLAKLLGKKDRLWAKEETFLAHPPWVAGMCMVFSSLAFSRVGGFDERYFLYYEDADICARLWLSGFWVLQRRDVFVFHEGARQSHRHFRHLYWHAQSAMRFFLSPASWKARRLVNKKLTIDKKESRGID